MLKQYLKYVCFRWNVESRKRHYVKLQRHLVVVRVHYSVARGRFAVFKKNVEMKSDV